MKKILISLSSVAVIGIGGVLTAGQLSEEEPKTEQVTAENNTATTETQEEVIHIPTERTVDVGGNYPWQFFDPTKIIELQNSEETVYLFSDADALENIVIEAASFEPAENSSVTKQSNAESVAEYLDLFITEVSASVDNQPYFDKLAEVESALRSGSYDAIPQLVKEATALRTQ